MPDVIPAETPLTTTPSAGSGGHARVCLFGLGEAGSLLAADLVGAGAEVSAYDPADVPTPDGVARYVHPALAVRPAEVVLAATAGRESRLALLQALDAMMAGTVYADLSTSAPGDELNLANEAVERDLAFADVALMAMVPGLGLATPALAAGPGARALADFLNPLGARIEPIVGLPGSASARKLLRSVMMKGAAAVLIEAVRAGAAADDLEWLWGNLETELAGADGTWMRRLVEGTSRHAGRRLDEMEAAIGMLDALGVEATMTRSTVASLAAVLDGAEVPDLPGVPRPLS